MTREKLNLNNEENILEEVISTKEKNLDELMTKKEEISIEVEKDINESTKLLETKKNKICFFSLLDPDNIILGKNSIGLHILKPNQSQGDHTFLLIEQLDNEILRDSNSNQGIQFLCYDFHYKKIEKEVSLIDTLWEPLSAEKYFEDGIDILKNFLEKKELDICDCNGISLTITGEECSKLRQNIKIATSALSALITSGAFSPSASVAGAKDSFGWCTNKVKKNTTHIPIADNLAPIEHDHLKQKSKNSGCFIL
jgi:hypothetical protein